MYHRIAENIEKQVRTNGKVVFSTCIKLDDIAGTVSSIGHQVEYVPTNGTKEVVGKFILTTTNNFNYIISNLELIETCKDPGQRIFMYIMILECALREANDVLMEKVVVESLDPLIVEAFLEKKFSFNKTKLDIDKNIYIYSGSK